MDGYKLWTSGSFGELWASEEVTDVMQKAPAQNRAKVIEYAKEAVENGLERLHREQYASQGRHDGVMLYAFKSYQLRVYFGIVGGEVNKIVCVEAKIKQTQKAPQSLLKRAARQVGE